ncbi:MAG: hypothetical protein ACJ74H_17670 [Thermoanaerobaculia bacterium]
MRSVADDLRELDLRQLQTLTAEERVALAFRLGARDLELFMATNQVDRDTAMRHFRRAGAAGRIRSVCNDER